MIEEKIRSGTLPPGLEEQYRIQLAEFESGKGGDCEVLVFPGAFRGRSTYYLSVEKLKLPYMFIQFIRT